MQAGPYSVVNGKKTDEGLHDEMLSSKSGAIAFEISAIRSFVKSGRGTLEQGIKLMASPPTLLWLKHRGDKSVKGGAGSGNFGHAGKPGEVGGSGAGGGTELVGDARSGSPDDQIAEIQQKIDTGVLVGSAAEEAREEIGGIGLMAVLSELLDGNKGES